jgi:DNA-binding response OmpR family regulator
MTMCAKIMIVEDNPDIRQALEVQLRTAAYKTVWAEDASGAVALCARESPDLILLDLSLVGGDGFMVMERLKQLSAHTPIIVLSARDPDLVEGHALQLGAVAFIAKPWRMEELLSVIKEHVADENSLLCRSGSK